MMRVDAQDLDLLITTYKHLNAEGTRPDLAASLLRMVNRLSSQNDGCEVYMALTREQINRNIPYQLVCETCGGSRWDTGTRKRRWEAEFSPAERRAADRLIRQAQTWTLKRGALASVKMPGAVYDLWQKLGDFCASL